MSYISGKESPGCQPHRQGHSRKNLLLRYYARECQRVNGKPKIVRTVYLGAADELIAAATKQKQQLIPQPQSVDIAAFGDVVAL